MTGKVGTDIEDNKCSWLVVQALQRVTTEQRQTLEVTDCVFMVGVHCMVVFCTPRRQTMVVRMKAVYRVLNNCTRISVSSKSILTMKNQVTVI